MLATALDYYRREDKQYWWEHFDRLGHPTGDWTPSRDLFVVESAEVVQEWVIPGPRARNLRRFVRLVGDWSAGSKVASRVGVVYATPGPPGCFGPERAPYAAANADRVETDPDDPRVVLSPRAASPPRCSPSFRWRWCPMGRLGPSASSRRSGRSRSVPRPARCCRAGARSTSVAVSSARPAAPGQIAVLEGSARACRPGRALLRLLELLDLLHELGLLVEVPSLCPEFPRGLVLRSRCTSHVCPSLRLIYR